ncbi:response regulator transcription factor [Pontiellaceae bacterium B1224]|nr:response regulator transcription factor [Pontiellaceae bacterium B1224]
MKRKIKIMMVEDHPEYRETIALALEKEKDIELISQFGTAEQALRSLQDMSTRKVPDLILLDLNLPGMSGIEAIPCLSQNLPDTKIIVLTQSNSEADVLAAIRAGASGYLLKGTKRIQIADGIRIVMNGGASLDPNIAEYILTTLKHLQPKPTLEMALSDREMQTLILISEGYVKKEIADRLGVSPYTVASFIKRIYEKLNVPNAPSAVNKAHLLGLFPNR